MIKAKEIIENLPQVNPEYNETKWRLKLDKNENIYSIPNYIISAIKNMDFDKISKYPNPDKLINKISNHYNIEYNNILLSNCTKEALRTVFDVYLEQDSEAIFYNNEPNLNQYIDKIKPCYFGDIKETKNSINEKTKIFYISSPNKLTGELIRPSKIEELTKEFKDILFVIDCSYINFAQNISLFDFFDLAKENENVVIIKSFSHDFSLAGLGLCFVYSNKSIIDNLKKTAFNNANSVALECGYSVLNNEHYFEEIKQQNIIAKELLYEGLKEKGFKPYESEANFILCNFSDYCDFYYQKLKNNGVIVRKFDKNSIFSTHLQITIPKTGGVKFILELLNKKDLLIFDMDGVVFDTSESYTNAIIQTFKHFSGFEVSKDEINKTKNLGGYNCDWNTTKHLLEEHEFYIDIEDIKTVFQDLFYNPELENKEFLINKEKLLISKETFETLSKKYDLVIFTGRLGFELDYSLKKFEINKFFNYKITADDLLEDELKPNPKGVFEILKHCPHKSVKYLGDSVDDIIAGNKANVCTIGVINKNADYSAMMNNFKHLCANYILKDINNLTQFLEENEQKEINLV